MANVYNLSDAVIKVTQGVAAQRLGLLQHAQQIESHELMRKWFDTGPGRNLTEQPVAVCVDAAAPGQDGALRLVCACGPPLPSQSAPWAGTCSCSCISKQHPVSDTLLMQGTPAGHIGIDLDMFQCFAESGQIFLHSSRKAGTTEKWACLKGSDMHHLIICMSQLVPDVHHP